MFIPIILFTFHLFMQSTEKIIALENYLSNLSNKNALSGSILIAHKSDIQFEKSYGHADIKNKLPNELNTIFKIASITKPVTATAIFQLQEKKLLSLDDPLSTFISDFPNGDKICIKHLLSHTSGIPDVSALPEFSTLKNNYTNPKKTSELIKRLEIQFVPGSKHSYSSSNYLILAYIIELVSQSSYEEYISHNILIPADMSNSFFYPQDQEKNNIALGYVKENDIQEASFLHMSWPSGSGGLYSNIHDLLKFSRALDTNILISSESFHQMSSVTIPMDHEEMGYGYGYEIGQLQNKKYIGHPGKMFGFSTYFLKFPDEELTIILLENLEDSLQNTKQKILTIASLHLN